MCSVLFYKVAWLDDFTEKIDRNVSSLFCFQKEHTEPMAGYLSLHQSANSLTIKWTPNQLMNGYTESEIVDKR